MLLWVLLNAWYHPLPLPLPPPSSRDFRADGYGGKVGGKLDKASGRTVKKEEGEALAQRNGATYFEVSSKTRENVKDPFLDTVTKIIETPALMNGGVGVRRDAVVPVNQGQKFTEDSGCNC